MKRRARGKTGYKGRFRVEGKRRKGRKCLAGREEKIMAVVTIREGRGRRGGNAIKEEEKKMEKEERRE